MLTVTRSKISNFVAKRQKQAIGSGETRVKNMLDNQPDPDSVEQDQWDLEYQRRLFDWAVPQVRNYFENTTWDAFWQTAVDGKPAKVVAESLVCTVLKTR